MGRNARIWRPGMTYHIMHRGAQKMNIYKEEEDKLQFLRKLYWCMKDYNCKLHAYCVMTNHYHLLLETTDMEIWRMMRALSRGYSVYHNAKYGNEGTLYNGRYKACIVDTPDYFLQVSRYINLNPVNAYMVHKPEDYKWSSYSALVGLEEDHLITHSRTFEYLRYADNPVYRYRLFVEDHDHQYDEQMYDIKNGIGDSEEWKNDNGDEIFS